MKAYNSRARAWKKRTSKVAARIAALGTIIDNEDDVNVIDLSHRASAVRMDLDSDDDDEFFTEHMIIPSRGGGSFTEHMLDPITDHDDIFEIYTSGTEGADVDDSEPVTVAANEQDEDVIELAIPDAQNDTGQDVQGEEDTNHLGDSSGNHHDADITWKLRHSRGGRVTSNMGGWEYGSRKAMS